LHLINYLTRVQFGFGSLTSLQAECDALGITRPLIVTDKGVVAAGLIDSVSAQLKTFSAEQLLMRHHRTPMSLWYAKRPNITVMAVLTV